MYKKQLAILFVMLFAITGYTQSSEVTIKSDGMEASNYLKMDDFYLTHYLYIDLFLREGLFVDASAEDVSTILKAIKTYVSVGNPLEIEIEKPGNRNYLIKMAILKKDDGTELLIAFTNWSVKKKLFEKEIKMENDSYTRWYFLNSSKMTYRQDMSDQTNYEELNKSDLANAYLFDELTENDSDIKTAIDQALEDESLSINDRIMTHLILLKYYIFKRESEKVNTQVESLKEEFANNSESNLKGLEMAFNATEFQIELMK
ncbi:hypothetical protein [Winogradskyella flava]|uniref:Uncharacterized protein n=1 Tax=Winogradskyella flava TaxID=1884876 RepID=A0A842IS65_9FLAO|nr:hypothetical protein [Winogradskyella flava]MBC2845605.1 hypothetical protein [Winogradskyella flava]